MVCADKKNKKDKLKGAPGKVGKGAVNAVMDPKKAAKESAKVAKVGAKAAKKAAQDVHGDVSLLFKPGEGAYMRNADKRSCTDCIPCGIFIAYWSFMVFLAHMAFTTGDLNALLFPRDMVSDAPRRPRRCTNERHCGA